MVNVLIIHVFIALASAQGYDTQLKRLQLNHKPQELSNAEIKFLASLSNTKYTNEVLDNILIPRVVGTPNHEKVFQYIKKELSKSDWNVEIDEFEDNTPNFGILKFRNIIATLNPNADRYLVLACHYDSKYFKNEVFVGATDSAVPCAMMLNLIKVMKKELDTVKDNADLNIKLIFFDGEEAFVNWGPKDSIYGARHLANLYATTKHRTKSTGEEISDLERIDMLVLLDLIGHKETSFYSNFQGTQNWYIRLATAEDRLCDLKLLKIPDLNKRYFKKRAFHGYIEDDHTPFAAKNVPILHLISNPFPTEWHTPADNRDIVDMNTIENINKILRVFLAEYLNVLVNGQ